MSVSAKTSVTTINFHPYMSDMTVEVEREFVSRDGLKLTRVKDLKGRAATVPSEWLTKSTKVVTDLPHPEGAVALTNYGVFLIKDTKKSPFADKPWLVKEAVNSNIVTTTSFSDEDLKNIGAVVVTDEVLATLFKK